MALGSPNLCQKTDLNLKRVPYLSLRPVRSLPLVPLNPIGRFRQMSISPTLLEAVWQRATTINGYDGGTWRTDAFGSPILRDDYGNKESKYGWVLGRIRRANPAREDCAADFRAIHWQNF